MRTALTWIAAALTGALVAVLGVLASFVWARRDDDTPRGFFAPAGAPRRYVDYLPDTSGQAWDALLTPAAIVGAVAGLIVLLVVRLLRRAAP